MLERPRLLPQEPSYSDPEARIAFLSGALAVTALMLLHALLVGILILAATLLLRGIGLAGLLLLSTILLVSHEWSPMV